MSPGAPRKHGNNNVLIYILSGGMGLGEDGVLLAMLYIYIYIPAECKPTARSWRGGQSKCPNVETHHGFLYMILSVDRKSWTPVGTLVRALTRAPPELTPQTYPSDMFCARGNRP